MMHYCYGLLIHEGGTIEMVRKKDGMTDGRWIREVLRGVRYGSFTEVTAPGGVMLFCPGAVGEAPVNIGAGEILRGKETVCGKALYLPGKEGDEYRFYSQDRAILEQKILGELLK